MILRVKSFCDPFVGGGGEMLTFKLSTDTSSVENTIFCAHVTKKFNFFEIVTLRYAGRHDCTYAPHCFVRIALHYTRHDEHYALVPPRPLTHVPCPDRSPARPRSRSTINIIIISSLTRRDDVARCVKNITSLYRCRVHSLTHLSLCPRVRLRDRG